MGQSKEYKKLMKLLDNFESIYDALGDKEVEQCMQELQDKWKDEFDLWCKREGYKNV